MDLPETSRFRALDGEHAGVERGHDLVLRWFPLASLAGVPLVPPFLRTALRQLPDKPEHVVIRTSGAGETEG